MPPRGLARAPLPPQQRWTHPSFFGKVKRPLQQAAYSAGVWRPRNAAPRPRVTLLDWNAAKRAWTSRGPNTNSLWYKEREQQARRAARRAAVLGPGKRAVQQAAYSLGVWRPRPTGKLVDLQYDPAHARWVPAGIEIPKRNYYQSKNYRDARKRVHNLARQARRNNSSAPSRTRSFPASLRRLTPPSLQRMMGRRYSI